MKKNWVIFIFLIGMFNFSEAEENVLAGEHFSGCEVLRPLFLDAFGELQRKKIKLRKFDDDGGEVKFWAVSKEGVVRVQFGLHMGLEFDAQMGCFSTKKMQLELTKLFGEKEEIELFCVFYETFWIDGDGRPAGGKGTTLDDGIKYILPGNGWNCSQYIVLYEAKLSE